MRNELLGYLLGALENHEHAQIESKLASDRTLQGQAKLLRKGLTLLEDDRERIEPPADLWQRTVDYVVLRAGLYLAVPAAEAAAVVRPGSSWSDGPPPTRKWRFADVSVAAGILVAAMSVVVPALIQSRANAQRVACQGRLQDAYKGIASYAGLHNGALPVASLSEGFQGKAGIYAPVLRDAGYLTSDEAVVCPGSDLADEDFAIPSVKQLKSANRQELVRLVRVMGGSYAFAIGYRENGRYRPLVLRSGANFPLMADTTREDGKPIGHHGACGRNVLTADGLVEYTYAHCWPGTRDNNIYANDEGDIDAGMRPQDSVLAHSRFGPSVRGKQLQIRNVDR